MKGPGAQYPNLNPGAQNPMLSQKMGRKVFRQGALMEEMELQKTKTMSLPIKFPGMAALTSQQLLDPVETRIKILEKQTQEELDALAAKKNAVKDLQKLLVAMKSTNAKLKSTNLFDSQCVFAKRTVQITASDGKSDYLTCSVSERASPREFEISIKQLARRDQLQPISSNANLQANSTSQAMNIAGSAVLQGQRITITATMSLRDIQYKFDRAGVEGKFSVYLDVVKAPLNGAPGNYRFQIQSKDVGIPLVVSEDNDSLMAQLNLVVSGKTEADLESISYINGIEIQRASNELSDITPSITFFLQRVTPNAETDQNFLFVSIISHKEAIREAVGAFLGSLVNFTDAYNLYCGRDNEGNPLSEEAVLAQENFTFLLKLRDFLISPRGFFSSPGKNNLTLDLAGRILDEGKPNLCGLTLFGISLERNDTDSILKPEFDQAHFDGIFQNHLNAIQVFFDFSFQSDNPYFSMYAFPDKASPSLYRKDIFVRAWMDGPTPKVEFALSVEQPNWVEGIFTRAGELKGMPGTAYEGITIIAVDFQNTLGNDPLTAEVSSFSFSKGHARSYEESIDSLNRYALEVKLKDLEIQEHEVIKKSTKELEKLKKEKEKVQQQIFKLTRAAQKAEQIEKQLKTLNSKKDD
ncbi:MAG: flagellar cap protein FliD N-terminal domain-containing protein [Alphaproteobacteria bacterium]